VANFPTVKLANSQTDKGNSGERRGKCGKVEGRKMATQTESDTWTMSGRMSAQDDNNDVDDDDSRRK